jgi:hypothetical protein
MVEGAHGVEGGALGRHVTHATSFPHKPSQNQYKSAKENLANLIRVTSQLAEHHTFGTQERYWPLKEQYERWIAECEKTHGVMPEGKTAVPQKEGSGKEDEGVRREGSFTLSGGAGREGSSGSLRDDGLGDFSGSSRKSELRDLSHFRATRGGHAESPESYGSQYATRDRQSVASLNTAMPSPMNPVLRQCRS